MPYEHAQITQTCSQQDDWGGKGGRWGPRADSSVAATARLHQARNPHRTQGSGWRLPGGGGGPLLRRERFLRSRKQALALRADCFDSLSRPLHLFIPCLRFRTDTSARLIENRLD